MLLSYEISYLRLKVSVIKVCVIKVSVIKVGVIKVSKNA